MWRTGHVPRPPWNLRRGKDYGESMSNKCQRGEDAVTNIALFETGRAGLELGQAKAVEILPAWAQLGTAAGAPACSRLSSWSRTARTDEPSPPQAGCKPALRFSAWSGGGVKLRLPAF